MNYMFANHQDKTAKNQLNKYKYQIKQNQITPYMAQ